MSAFDVGDRPLTALDAVDEVARDRGFRRQRRHSPQLAHLAERARLDRIGKLSRFDLSLEKIDEYRLPQASSNPLAEVANAELLEVLDQRLSPNDRQALIRLPSASPQRA